MPAYNKPVQSPSQLTDHLVSRGLIVKDPALAEHVFATTSYYRFKGYALPFRELNSPDKPFRPNVTFEDILALQQFDCKIRKHFMHAIECIELSFRTTFSEKMAQKYNTPFWYQDRSHFMGQKDHDMMLDKCNKEFSRSKELFVKHYKNNYGDPYLPPVWMLTEVTSFGLWSKLYKELKYKEDKQLVADFFGQPHQLLQSWIHALVTVRNVCAHHGRLWNRIFGVVPKLPRKINLDFVIDNRRLAAFSVVVFILLERINTGDGIEWEKRLCALMQYLPSYRVQQMGFKEYLEGNIQQVLELS